MSGRCVRFAVDGTSFAPATTAARQRNVSRPGPSVVVRRTAPDAQVGHRTAPSNIRTPVYRKAASSIVQRCSAAARQSIASELGRSSGLRATRCSTGTRNHNTSRRLDAGTTVASTAVERRSRGRMVNDAPTGLDSRAIRESISLNASRCSVNRRRRRFLSRFAATFRRRPALRFACRINASWSVHRLEQPFPGRSQRIALVAVSIRLHVGAAQFLKQTLGSGPQRGRDVIIRRVFLPAPTFCSPRPDLPQGQRPLCRTVNGAHIRHPVIRALMSLGLGRLDSAKLRAAAGSGKRC